MKYPFLDTPSNRKLESLIAQCVDPEMIVSRDLGRFIFHVFPHATVTEVSKPDGWDMGVKYSAAHVAVIDKDTGLFGMALLQERESYNSRITETAVNIRDLIATLNEEDIKAVYTKFPQLVNISRKDDAFTYHDHYQSLVEKDDPSQTAYNKDIEWLIENGHKKAGSIDAPEEIARLIKEKLSNWKGRKTEHGEPASGNRLLTRYASYGILPDLLIKNFRVDSVVKVDNYLQDDEYRESMKDIKTSLDPDHLRHRDAEIVLDIPMDEYYVGRDRMYESMRTSYKAATETYRERFLESYCTALSDKYMSQRDKMSEHDVDVAVGRINHYLRKDVGFTKMLISDTPSAVRNKLQILDSFDGNTGTLTALMRDEKIMKGIEDGRPMKETLGHLPLLNTSKKTINAYMNNFKNYLSFNGDPVDLMTEKGVSQLTKLNLGTTSVMGDNIHNSIALITTLPETHLIDEQRNADNMLSVLSGFPKLIDTLSHRCIEAKEGRSDIQNMMSWVPGEISDIEKRPQTVRDATTIFTGKYFGTVVRHLKQDMIGTDDSFKYALSFLKEDELMSGLIKTGEYRNILAFDEDIHKNVHQLFKLGKPDTDVEWERTIDEDFNKNGYSISPITSNADLSQEGAELNHCVGSYLQKVLGNESYIFSVTRDGKRVSTIELSENGAGEMEIVQHFAKGNTQPPQEAIDAANDFCEAINNEDIDFDTSPCDDSLIDEAFDEDMQVEQEEMEFGLRFSDRDFVLYAIDSMNRILPSFDVWKTLEKEDIPASDIEKLKQDFEITYEKNAELAS